jgi:drug/metabolite transporter (DMT)-like permease
MTAPPEQTPSSLGARLELLPRAMAAILSLSALGYFIGWQEANAYYRALGAAWATDTVPPLELLQLSASTIVAIALATFFSLVLLLDEKVSLRKLGWLCAAFLGIAGICLSSSQGLFGDPSPSNAHALAAAGSVLFAVSAGATLSQLIGYVRQSNQKISSGHLWLVYWFVLPGLFWAPDRLGQARALRDSEPSSSSLPVVEIQGSSKPGEWRLVQLVEDKALLMTFADEGPKRLFKFVEAKDVKAFSSTLRPSAAKK